MNEKQINWMFKYLKVGALVAAACILFADNLKAMYEPIDVHLDVERIEQETREKEPDTDRFPDIKNGGWV